MAGTGGAATSGPTGDALDAALVRLPYLNHYPPALQQQVRTLIDEGRVARYLQGRYPDYVLPASDDTCIKESGSRHAVQSDKALYAFCADVKQQFLRSAPPVDKVLYDNKLDVVRHALGLHTAISRVQGGKLKAKKEIRIASLFRDTPLAFLRMIVVHEVAHLKEPEHDKAFYRLCEFMEPDYHQIELDLRIHLTAKQLRLIA